MDRLRIVHFIHSLELGGAQRVILHVLRHLDPRRFEARVVSLYPPTGSVVESELRQREVPLHFLGKRPGPDASALMRFHRLLGAHPPDVLHSHCYGLTYAYVGSMLRRVPARVHTMHTVAESEVTSRVEQALYRSAFRGGVVPVAIIREVAESLKRVYGMEDPLLIPNGIPIDELQSPDVAREAWRRAEGLDVNDVVFTCVARLNHPKNQAGIVRAFAGLDPARTQARLLLVGDGPDRPALEDLAASTGAADRIHFLGERADVPAILGASDVFVLFSTYEGNPLSVMEAMAAGRPVLSSRVGGIPELIGRGEAGVLVSSQDVAGLTSAMDRLSRDADLRSRLGRAGADRAKRRFSARAMAGSYMELYESLLRDASPRA